MDGQSILNWLVTVDKWTWWSRIDCRIVVALYTPDPPMVVDIVRLLRLDVYSIYVPTLRSLYILREFRNVYSFPISHSHSYLLYMIHDGLHCCSSHHPRLKVLKIQKIFLCTNVFLVNNRRVQKLNCFPFPIPILIITMMASRESPSAENPENLEIWLLWWRKRAGNKQQSTDGERGERARRDPRSENYFTSSPCWSTNVRNMQQQQQRFSAVIIVCVF